MQSTKYGKAKDSPGDLKTLVEVANFRKYAKEPNFSIQYRKLQVAIDLNSLTENKPKRSVTMERDKGKLILFDLVWSCGER